jgi:hypothetical protein
MLKILASLIHGSKGESELAKKIAPVIHADMLCLNEIDRAEILNQVGISSETFTNGFNIESMSNLWSLELLMISKLKRTDLVARLAMVRQKFRSQVGDAVYQDYISSLADGLTEEKIKMLITEKLDNETQAILEEAIRGDIITLTRQIQRLSYYKFLRLDNIYKVKGTILRILITVLALMFRSLFLRYVCDYKFASDEFHPQSFSLIVVTIFSGMVGSCMSLLQRTEQASNAPSSFTDSALDAMEIKLSMSIWYIVSLTLSGAIFATILYLLAVSDSLMLGDLFPKLALDTTPPFCKSSVGIDVLFGCIKSEPKNALMLVWGFLAGFAERLVPDTLDSLIQKTQKPET